MAAVSTMFVALENSSKILAKNLANNTVMIVSHKYGPDMAAATDAAFATAGNSYQTFYNVGALGMPFDNELWHKNMFKLHFSCL